MSLFGFNKGAKHRKFDYIPRFYDPAKEELEERLQKYDDKEVDRTELAKTRIKHGLRRDESGIDQGSTGDQTVINHGSVNDQSGKIQGSIRDHWGSSHMLQRALQTQSKAKNPNHSL